ncbi:MAG: type II toxin-antitoxin system VapC family toxin [Candidatus Freyarchaeota archaeon]
MDYSDDPFVKLKPVDFKLDVDAQTTTRCSIKKERDAVEIGSVSARNFVFVDTSAFKAHYDRKDRHHKAARNFVARVVEREIEFRLLVTSDYVLDETATLVKRAVGAKEASRFLRAVQDSKMIRVVHVGKKRSELLPVFMEVGT